MASVRTFEFRRLFVALWSSGNVRDALKRQQAEFELEQIGRCTTPEKFHITLHFIGEVPNSQCQRIAASVGSIDFDPFELKLDRIGFFTRSRVAWAGCAAPNPQLDALAHQVRNRISQTHTGKGRQEFTPHVTLARKVRKRIDARIDPIVWRVDRCCLVESVKSGGGVKYVTLAESGSTAYSER